MHSPYPQLFGFVPSHTALTSRQPSWRPIIRYLPYGVGRVGLGGKLGSLPSGFRRERFCFSGLPPDSISKPRRRTRSDSLPRRPISGHTSLATVCLRPFLSTPPASPPRYSCLRKSRQLPLSIQHTRFPAVESCSDVPPRRFRRRN